MKKEVRSNFKALRKNRADRRSIVTTVRSGNIPCERQDIPIDLEKMAKAEAKRDRRSKRFGK